MWHEVDLLCLPSHWVLFTHAEVHLKVAYFSIVIAQEVELFEEFVIKRLKVVEAIGLANQLAKKEPCKLRTHCDAVVDSLAEYSAQKPIEVDVFSAK